MILLLVFHIRKTENVTQWPLNVHSVILFLREREKINVVSVVDIQDANNSRAS